MDYTLRVMVGSQKHCSSLAVVVFGRNPVPCSVTFECNPVSNRMLSNIHNHSTTISSLCSTMTERKTSKQHMQMSTRLPRLWSL